MSPSTQLGGPMAHVRFLWHFYVMRPVFMTLLDSEERLVATAFAISSAVRAHGRRRARDRA